jgi:hypothetical protein
MLSAMGSVLPCEGLAVLKGIAVACMIVERAEEDQMLADLKLFKTPDPVLASTWFRVEGAATKISSPRHRGSQCKGHR